MKQHKKMVVLLSVLVLLTGMMCSLPFAQMREQAQKIKKMEGTISGIAATMTMQVSDLMTRAVSVVTEISTTETPETLATEEPVTDTGSITGKLSYPSEFIPPLRIVAFRVDNNSLTGEWYSIETELNQTTYQLDDLPLGTYYVMAYLKDTDASNLKAGYTQAVPCGLKASCSDHNLIPVMVIDSNLVGGIDPGDWYATPEDFPPDPTK